ncbi:tRNA lysidine(34) synthetase TilS [Weeksellaceae bacterium TAE3-ERU29]|nr:tRNA lysidine(34) synthetase TilS [Weeksellaceae bacterium TAE3-ERU29]
MLNIQNTIIIPEIAIGKKLLVAVSGGVDSMVLLYFLLKSGYNVSVAHMNFNLRPEECDKDQKLVQDFCKRYQIPFFVKSVDTKKYKEEHKLSTQIAARELRYNWFDELIEKHQFDFLVTAHHLDDNIETFLINVLRGSGINGSSGIPNFQNKILRPLLNCSKKEIKDFAIKNNIEWREDSSNSENDYLRNSIRNLVLPELEKINEDYRSGFRKSLNFLNQDLELLNNHIQKTKSRIFQKSEFGYSINIEELKALNPLETYIFHLFKEFGFNAPQEIIKLLNAENSAEIITENYRLIKDRTDLLLSQKETQSNEGYKIELNKNLKTPFKWIFSKETFTDSQFLINFDAEKIQFPIFLRKKQEGDVFFPTGMQGKKKLSKFFKDLKLNKLQKEETWVLTTAENQIIWVVGLRADRRFSSNNKTKVWLNLKELG